MRTGYQFNWNPVLDNLPNFVAGAAIDLYVAGVSFALACLVGLLVATLRLSPSRLASVPANLYVQIVRGIPAYVALLWVYFGLATVAGIVLSPIQAAIATAAVAGSGYTSEIFRGGLQSVDGGHVEAARALGLTRRQTFWDVVFPQAIRIVVPPLGNTFVGILKGVSIISLIAVPDMVFVAVDLNVNYFVPFEAYSAVAGMLVGLVLVFSGFVFVLERSLRLP